MVAAGRRYASPHRLNPSLKWAGDHWPPKCGIFNFFAKKNTSPKWRSRRWLEIAQNLFHQRVGDKILRQKFGIHLSSISNNKGATAPRKLPYGLKAFSKNLLLDLDFFRKILFFCYIPAIFNISKPRLRKNVPFDFAEILQACPQGGLIFIFWSIEPFSFYFRFNEKLWTLIAPPFWIGLFRNLVWGWRGKSSLEDF